MKIVLEPWKRGVRTQIGEDVYVIEENGSFCTTVLVMFPENTEVTEWKEEVVTESSWSFWLSHPLEELAGAQPSYLGRVSVRPRTVSGGLLLDWVASAYGPVTAAEALKAGDTEPGLLMKKRDFVSFEAAKSYSLGWGCEHFVTRKGLRR